MIILSHLMKTEITTLFLKDIWNLGASYIEVEKSLSYFLPIRSENSESVDALTKALRGSRVARLSDNMTQL